LPKVELSKKEREFLGKYLKQDQTSPRMIRIQNRWEREAESHGIVLQAIENEQLKTNVPDFRQEILYGFM